MTLSVDVVYVLLHAPREPQQIHRQYNGKHGIIGKLNEIQRYKTDLL